MMPMWRWCIPSNPASTVLPLCMPMTGYHLFEVLDKKPAIPFDIVNHVMDKKMLRELVDYVYRNLGPKATVILSDRLKDLGYKFSTQGGLSISIDAMITPEGKQTIIDRCRESGG